MNVQAFLEVLPLAGEGMLGVFATIIVLIAGVALLNRFGKKKSGSKCPLFVEGGDRQRRSGGVCKAFLPQSRLTP